MYLISWRYLWSRKKQTILIFLGVILGTAAYVTISGMMLGFQNYIREKLIDNEPHITITKREKPIIPEMIAGLHYPGKFVLWFSKPGGYRTSETIENPPFWSNFLSQQPNVIAWVENLVIDALIRRSSFEKPIRLIGTKAADQIKVTNFEHYMVEGTFLSLTDAGKKIIIGKALAERLGTKIGETLEIVLSNGRKGSFKVEGLFELGIKNIDEGTVFAGLLDVQALKNSPGAISQISIKVDNVDVAKELSAIWQNIAQEKIASWEENNESILSVFRTQDIVRNFMTISILIVASFGIYNILSILIAQKQRDIAIFRALGFYPEDVIKIFLWQGLIIGLIGGILGLLIGNLVCHYLSTIEVASGKISGMGSKMLISFDTLIYVKAFLLAFVSCLLSSYLPSRAAGKLEPMDIFRAS